MRGGDRARNMVVDTIDTKGIFAFIAFLCVYLFI